jgi:ATP synthase F1 gamma subunit
MATIAEIKKEKEFYQDFSSLIEVLKAIAIAQFHALQHKIRTFEKFTTLLAGFFDLLDVESVAHPFAQEVDLPLGIVTVTSDTGLLGGLNNRIMVTALNYLRSEKDRLIVIGTQGKNFTRGLTIPVKTFPGIQEERRYMQALEIRNYIVKEVLTGQMGPVKIIYPFAPSIAVQQVVELDLLPCSKWPKEKEGPTTGELIGSEIILESLPEDMVEYSVSLWIAQKLYEIFQLSRLAEYAARVVHLEESSQKIKEIEKKLQLKYFRARHEIIDQQMRELFAARH